MYVLITLTSQLDPLCIWFNFSRIRPCLSPPIDAPWTLQTEGPETNFYITSGHRSNLFEIDTSWHSIIFDSFKMQRVSSPELIWDSTRQFVTGVLFLNLLILLLCYLQPVGLSQTVQSWCTMCIPWPWTSWTLCCPTSLGGREPMHINRLKQVKIPERLNQTKFVPKTPVMRRSSWLWSLRCHQAWI